MRPLCFARSRLVYYCWQDTQKRRVIMSKLLYCAILAAVAALLACSSPTPTPVPTDTPVPTATLAPTWTPIPTPTPMPTATPVPTAAPKPAPANTPEPTESAAPESVAPTEAMPKETAGSGGIAPLRMDDPAAIAAELSESELACLAEVAATDRLLQLFAAPELASPEEQTQLIGCLEDETTLRIFLTGLIGDTGPLSEETSTCIRTGMAGIDLRSVMLAGTTGDEQAAMIGGMSGMLLTLSCLNEEEWETAAPALGMQPGERENLQCVMEQMGGPEGMAATLGAGDESSFMALFGAAMGCGLQMEPPSGG